MIKGLAEGIHGGLQTLGDDHQKDWVASPTHRSPPRVTSQGFTRWGFKGFPWLISGFFRFYRMMLPSTIRTGGGQERFDVTFADRNRAVREKWPARRGSSASCWRHPPGPHGDDGFDTVTIGFVEPRN
jgi:hypothetical protein